MRVLVIEDEERFAEGLRIGLEAEGFAVDVAFDGTDGLWRARENPYDAIVLDIMLPGLNGYRVCAALRAEGNWTPILMLTAKEGEWDEVEGLDTGADDYLTKPFSYAVLLARLRALLRRDPRERPATLTAGDLRLDPAAKEVSRGGERVELTARELALLEFLLRRRGETVSKREILAHVWDDDFDGDPNIVEVYVRHLRNKLDRPFGRAAIETVRGCGYRWPPMGVRHGVRFRSTVAAVLIVAVGLVAGAVALVTLLRAELTDDVRQAARARAEQVTAVIESGRGVPALTVSERDEQFIQVLAADGTVVAASANVEELPALARPGKAGDSRIRTPLDEDEFLVVATVADGPGGQKTVLVGRALIAVAESTKIVTRLLLVGLPLLLLLAAAATWMAVGRALAPVASIQAEVEAISSAQLHRRVPLPRGRDEIAGLAATMNRMLDRLERAQSAQRRFISDASHELRSPVASIRQHAEVALAHPGRTTKEGLAATVLAEDLRIQRLVDDLLLLARADEDGLRPNLQPVDVDDLVLDEARRLRSTAAELRVSTAGVSPARLDADPQGLRRVLRNLGDNAARHARTQVAFDLAATKDGRIVLGVEDDGPGVPDGDRERIFERFVRLDDARSRSVEDGGGSGLGLAIVAELVAAHGGSVTVSHGALGGARFEVSFPSGEGRPGRP